MKTCLGSNCDDTLYFIILKGYYVVHRSELSVSSSKSLGGGCLVTVSDFQRKNDNWAKFGAS